MKSTIKKKKKCVSKLSSSPSLCVLSKRSRRNDCYSCVHSL